MTTYIDMTNQVLGQVNDTPLTESNFASATSIQAVAKRAVLESIREINQYNFEWPFNHRTATVVLTPEQATYSFPDDYKVADWDTFFVARDDDLDIRGETLPVVPYDEWHTKLRERDVNRESGSLSVPQAVYPTQNNGFGISPPPNEAYTITYEYWIHPTLPSAATDTLPIPEAYDRLILQGAMYHIYMFLDNIEEANEAKNRFRQDMKDIRTIEINKYEYVWDTRLFTGRRRFGLAYRR